MTNTDLAFFGSVPELYTRYMGPAFFEPYAEVLARKFAGTKSGNVLETACGTGIVTRALRRALPATVALTATDLNQAMLDHGRALPGGDNVRWQQADAQALPFPDASFNAVVTAFGAMFFPDKVGAYREVLRVLRPGGKYLLSIWNRIETIDLNLIADATVAALFPLDPPSFLRRLPSGYHDVDAIRADLEQAGFADIEIETVELPCRTASARDAAIGLVRGTPLSAEIASRDPAGLDRATDAVAAAIAARFGAGPVEARMQAHVVTARSAS